MDVSRLARRGPHCPRNALDWNECARGGTSTPIGGVGQPAALGSPCGRSGSRRRATSELGSHAARSACRRLCRPPRPITRSKTNSIDVESLVTVHPVRKTPMRARRQARLATAGGGAVAGRHGRVVQRRFRVGDPAKRCDGGAGRQGECQGRETLEVVLAEAGPYARPWCGSSRLTVDPADPQWRVFCQRNLEIWRFVCG